jgi:hypothetical protein
MLFTKRDLPGYAGTVRQVRYFPAIEKWVAVGDGRHFFTSDDAITWQKHQIPDQAFNEEYIWDVFYQETFGIYYFSIGRDIAVTPDFQTWNYFIRGSGYRNIGAIIYHPDIDRVMINAWDFGGDPYNASPRLITSTDGVNFSVGPIWGETDASYNNPAHIAALDGWLFGAMSAGNSVQRELFHRSTVRNTYTRLTSSVAPTGTGSVFECAVSLPQSNKMAAFSSNSKLTMCTITHTTAPVIYKNDVSVGYRCLGGFAQSVDGKCWIGSLNGVLRYSTDDLETTSTILYPADFFNHIYGVAEHAGVVVIAGPDGLASNQAFTIGGQVVDRYGNPVQRIVRLYLRANGKLVSETLSDQSTGEYSFTIGDSSMYQAICLADDTAEGQIFNDQIYRVIPN